MPTTKIVVNIPGETPYDMRIGDSLLGRLGEHLRQIDLIKNAPMIAVVSDSNVAPLYLTAVKSSLVGAQFKVCDLVVDAGEKSKSCEVIADIWNALADLGMTRDCVVLALGGGVVGDLSGFAAATFMRGIPVVQVPTSLLAMVDSSVGGKTGIDLVSGKNLVGSFLQPSYVCASLDVLSTLPAREWICGCGEIAKSAVIDSDDFFFWLMDNARALRNRDLDVTAEAIRRSIVFKAAVVAEDKTESRGVRECLNYGHTLAHAIESMCGYGYYSHGAAVAEGMRFATFLASRISQVSVDFQNAQSQMLDELALEPLNWLVVASAECGSSISASDIIECMKHDKKVRDGALRFVLVSDVGAWQLVNVDDALVASALSEFYDL